MKIHRDRRTERKKRGKTETTNTGESKQTTSSFSPLIWPIQKCWHNGAPVRKNHRRSIRLRLILSVRLEGVSRSLLIASVLNSYMPNDTRQLCAFVIKTMKCEIV